MAVSGKDDCDTDAAAGVYRVDPGLGQGDVGPGEDADPLDAPCSDDLGAAIRVKETLVFLCDLEVILEKSQHRAPPPTSRLNNC